MPHFAFSISSPVRENPSVYASTFALYGKSSSYCSISSIAESAAFLAVLYFLRSSSSNFLTTEDEVNSSKDPDSYPFIQSFAKLSGSGFAMINSYMGMIRFAIPVSFFAFEKHKAASRKSGSAASYAASMHSSRAS